MPRIDIDSIIIVLLILPVMLIGMRLIYGYWPWQLHPTLRRQRQKIVEQLTTEHGFNFEPINKTGGPKDFAEQDNDISNNT